MGISPPFITISVRFAHVIVLQDVVYEYVTVGVVIPIGTVSVMTVSTGDVYGERPTPFWARTL